MNGPNEGTLFCILRFAIPWPSPVNQIILRRPHEGGMFELTSGREGRLAFAVTDANGSSITSFLSQRVVIHGTGFVALTAIWAPGRCELRLNESILLPEGTSSELDVFTGERPVVS